MKNILLVGLLLATPSEDDIALYNKVKANLHNKSYIEGFCDAVRAADRSRGVLKARHLTFSAVQPSITIDCIDAL